MFVLYDIQSFAPNPFVVTMFAREKGIGFERRIIDVANRENRRPPYVTDVNPLGEVPAAEFSQGQILTEVVPICEYLEELHPDPALIGTTAWERAETRMWTRRIDLKIAEPMSEAFVTGAGRSFFDYKGDDDASGGKIVLPAEASAPLRASADSSCYG